jgi:hypothetical protein
MLMAVVKQSCHVEAIISKVAFEVRKVVSNMAVSILNRRRTFDENQSPANLVFWAGFTALVLQILSNYPVPKKTALHIFFRGVAKGL